MYSYERMLQRQNEARRMMNNQERRMFKREAEGSFEYGVTAEHSADNNRQMVIHPQQTYSMNQMDNRMNQMNQMDSRMNQMNQMDNRMNQYNMDSRMNRNQMMNNRFDSRMNRNQMMNNHFDSRMQYNMDNRMNNMEQRQFEQRHGMEGNTFGFDRASMQYFPSQFQQQQEQLRNYL